MKEYPFYIANQPETPDRQPLEVLHKYTGEVAAQVPLATAADIDRGIDAATQAAPGMADMPAYERRSVLNHCVKRFRERFDELAHALCVEAGKPIKDSRGEVQRLIDTFQIAADESVQSHGETLNLEISERARGYRGFTKRVPVGPCSFITPFNFPLNLVAHKVAPALACGCPFVLKVDSRTPLGGLILGEILAETNLPRGAFSVFPCEVSEAGALTADERLKLLSFTGSPKVGWALKSKAGKKKVVLELGGNAACVVDAGADLEDAIPRIVTGAFYQSGQSCVSVQRIYVHHSLLKAFEEKIVAQTNALQTGDPEDPNTFVGPLIMEAEAERLENWIQEARQAGADILCGGTRDGALLYPTVLNNVPHDQKLYGEEAFGPVAVIEPFEDYEEVLDRVNESAYGIHAGVFTPHLEHAMQAWDRLEVGGVLINEVPSWRVDNLPYGGVKDSGIGREGVRYAMQDMTEIRSLVIRQTS